VLLPEQPVGGASAHLFPGNGSEHLTANAESVGALHATEILRWSDVPRHGNDNREVGIIAPRSWAFQGQRPDHRLRRDGCVALP
jgi:hypothetical protein